jgi:hypothetical protein
VADEPGFVAGDFRRHAIFDSLPHGLVHLRGVDAYDCLFDHFLPHVCYIQYRFLSEKSLYIIGKIFKTLGGYAQAMLMHCTSNAQEMQTKQNKTKQKK